MINIADKYGLRDIMNGTLYSINKEGLPVKPVLFLDTLKVSTIETHCETTLAEGGKGYASLISWDYQRDITINGEDIFDIIDRRLLGRWKEGQLSW